MTIDERQQDELEALAELDAFVDAEIERRAKAAAPPPTPEQRWNDRQATLPPEREERAIVSVLEQTLRNDRVRINMAEAERQYWERQQAQEAAVRNRREADPFNMGHWGRNDD
jgi:hypothetical protein